MTSRMEVPRGQNRGLKGKGTSGRESRPRSQGHLEKGTGTSGARGTSKSDLSSMSTLEFMVFALLSFGHSRFTYASWIQYFDEGEGRERGLVVKALISYYLSCFVLMSG